MTAVASLSEPDTPEPEIERDRLGRPRVIPPSEVGKENPATVAYTRCTTFVGCLEDRYNLEKWQQRMVLIGLADSPELVLSAAAHRDDNSMLNRIAEDAQTIAKARKPATVGTAVHKFIADVDRGIEIGRVPGDWMADIEAYKRATAPFTNELVERFVVCDELGIGGTPDRIVSYQGRRYIADAKTGDISRAGKIAMQLAVYAHSELYDLKTGKRTPLDVDQRNGIIVHLPAGTGTCELYWVDLAKGWEAVLLAAQVREWRSGQRNLVAPFVA